MTARTTKEGQGWGGPCSIPPLEDVDFTPKR
jgi:hypothetical protein